MGLFVHKNQGGLALPLIVALVVVILGVGGATYYFVTKDKDTGGSAVNKQAEDECKQAIDDKDLCRFASSYNLGDNYTAVIKSSSEGKASTMTILYDGDNFQSTTAVEGSATAEMISHDGATYIKNPDDGTWMKYPASEDTPEVPAESDDYTPELDFDDANMPDYTKKGKEACGNLTCFRYDFTDPEVPNSTYSIWFDDKDYKLRKMVSTGTEGNMEITYSYGDVKIDPPANFTELPSFDANDTMTEEEIQQLMEQYAN